MPLYKSVYYADGGTPMSAAQISAAQATSVGDLLEPLLADTGWVTNALTANGSDWTIGTQYCRVENGRVEVQINITYNGATITAPADGNIANVIFATILAGYRPKYVGSLSVVGSGRVASFGFTSNGSGYFAAVSGGANVIAGANWTLQGSWMAP